MTEAARRAADHAARTSYGKLLAILASRSRDIALAEDALAGAFAKALQVWPAGGVPGNPDAWLLTTARNAMANLYRHDRMRADAASELARHYDELAEAPALTDERLKLLFVCAHPAIDPSARTPMMLQTVLGLDAARIGAAFVTLPATMSQRLVRAKVRIRDTGLRFEVPEPDMLRDRLADVLEAIYAAFGTGWDAGIDQPDLIRGLPEEAIYLGRLVVGLLPDAPDAMGLLSLMLFVHARRRARRGDDGAFVPLTAQDTALWDRNMVIEAEALLTTAARLGQFGRFQCEAAIQSVHAQRAITGALNLDALETLYRLLVTRNPTVGGVVALASVLRQKGQLAEALALLDGISSDAVARYQPFWVLRAHCLRDLGDLPNAEASARTGVALTDDRAVRDHLAGVFGLTGTV